MHTIGLLLKYDFGRGGGGAALCPRRGHGFSAQRSGAYMATRIALG